VCSRHSSSIIRGRACNDAPSVTANRVPEHRSSRCYTQQCLLLLLLLLPVLAATAAVIKRCARRPHSLIHDMACAHLRVRYSRP
jgi:hypothetical protein